MTSPSDLCFLENKDLSLASVHPVNRVKLSFLNNVQIEVLDFFLLEVEPLALHSQSVLDLFKLVFF